LILFEKLEIPNDLWHGLWLKMGHRSLLYIEPAEAACTALNHDPNVTPLENRSSQDLP
jgi:hypothetical protein